MSDSNKQPKPKQTTPTGDGGFGDWVNDNGTLIGFIMGALFVAIFAWNAISSLF